MINTLDDGDDQVRQAAATALGFLRVTGDQTIINQIVESLIKTLQDQQGSVRFAAAESLGKLGVRCRKDVLDGLVSLLDDNFKSSYHDKYVRDAAFDALWALAPYSNEEPLIE